MGLEINPLSVCHIFVSGVTELPIDSRYRIYKSVPALLFPLFYFGI